MEITELRELTKNTREEIFNKFIENLPFEIVKSAKEGKYKLNISNPVKVQFDKEFKCLDLTDEEYLKIEKIFKEKGFNVFKTMLGSFKISWK